MRKLTVQVQTRDDLRSLLASAESPAWVIGQSKERFITDVQVVSFDGSQMIEADFDRRHSWRRDDADS